MTSRDINDLSPTVKDLCIKLIDEVQKRLGIRIIVTCTKRDKVDQCILYMQGRTDQDLVNYYRAAFSMPKADSANKVTWTLHSRHYPNETGPDVGKAEAFDVVIYVDGKTYWDIVKTDINKDQIPDYKQIAEIGRELGLKPGADFGDYAHFQNILLPI
jgi:hypothetical protein